MLTRILNLILLPLCLGAASTALAGNKKASWWDKHLPKPYIDAKAGYFFFSSSDMSDVYDHGGIDVQISGAYPLVPFLRIYGSAEYLRKSGHSTVSHDSTTFWAVPFSLGLQPTIGFGSVVSWYATLGPRYFLTRVSSDTSYIPKHIHSNGFGAFVNTGLLFTFCRHLALDIFGEYSYARLPYQISSTQRQTSQVGGFTIGGGLGYVF